MNQASSQIPTDVRERVIAAAAELYQQAGRERFPTVDAVRRLSRADMNSVTVLMREWRQSQTTQAAPVAVMIPDAVQQANAAAVAAMWTQATELANQSLRSAQAGWEAERQDLDDMRSELATGYEVQAAELEAVKGQLSENIAALDVAGKQLADSAAKLAAAVADLATAKAKADASEQSHQEQRKLAAQETHRVTERMAKLEAERDAARKESGAAREEAANLRGQNEAMKSQNSDLMKTLGKTKEV